MVLIPSRLPLSQPEPPAQYPKHPHPEKKENFTDKYNVIPLYTHTILCALSLFKETRLGYPDKPVTMALRATQLTERRPDDSRGTTRKAHMRRDHVIPNANPRSRGDTLDRCGGDRLYMSRSYHIQAGHEPSDTPLLSIPSNSSRREFIIYAGGNPYNCISPFLFLIMNTSPTSLKKRGNAPHS